MLLLVHVKAWNNTWHGSTACLCHYIEQLCKLQFVETLLHNVATIFAASDPVSHPLSFFSFMRDETGDKAKAVINGRTNCVQLNLNALKSGTPPQAQRGRVPPTAPSSCDFTQGFHRVHPKLRPSPGAYPLGLQGFGSALLSNRRHAQTTNHKEKSR